MSTTNSPVRSLIEAFSEQVLRREAFVLRPDPADFEAGRAILELPRERQVEVVLDIVPRQVDLINGHNTTGSFELTALLSAILRKKLPFSADQLEFLIRSLAGVTRDGWWGSVSSASIVRLVEEYVGENGLSESMAAALQILANQLRGQQYYVEPRKLLRRIDKFLQKTTGSPAVKDKAAELPTIPMRHVVELTTNEMWTHFLRAALDDMDDAQRKHWNDLLAHCEKALSSKPTQKWVKEAAEHIQAIGIESFRTTLSELLGEIGEPGERRVAPINALGFSPDPTQVHEAHSDLLRGLVWCAGLVEHESLITAVGQAADACFKKLPGVGPRAPKIGNACLWALANLSSTPAVAELSRLKTRAKHVSIKNQLAKALDTAAEKTGLSAQDLEEIAIPTCGLTAIGERRQTLGEYTAQVQVVDSKGELTWLKPDGKIQASVPAAIKESHREELQSLQKATKEIAKLLPAQRDRLELLFLQQRSWTLADFRTRYLDHPLVGTLARRLIWRFTAGPVVQDGIYHGDGFVNAQDRPLDVLTDATRVALWHPLDGPVDGVKAWRDWLEVHQVRQPFKQAHREIYVLTDAERRTAFYSNRFAAHILKQHQFSALCLQRGWRYHLQGAWDSANMPILELPAWDIKVEFWIQAIEQEGSLFERSDITHHAIYLYLTTDQVRFYRMRDYIPLALTEVPPLVFSEVLRDVDLFVGVAGIGNDPTWNDGGATGQFRDYWHNYSFGELLPSAETRKSVLERIVPRLKIADRCTFSDKFLIVRGDLHTYKIHLGSGNILMSPNDLYLCIVPKPGGIPSKMFLPFDGDTMLSIILSKAFLLAEDTKITDPSIVSQLKP